MHGETLKSATYIRKTFHWATSQHVSFVLLSPLALNIKWMFLYVIF